MTIVFDLYSEKRRENAACREICICLIALL